MRPLVGGKVVTSGEDLITDCAGVRLVASVQSHVPRQHVTASKGTVADSALHFLDKRKK